MRFVVQLRAEACGKYEKRFFLSILIIVRKSIKKMEGKVPLSPEIVSYRRGRRFKPCIAHHYFE
jgi:hypothetical protein